MRKLLLLFVAVLGTVACEKDHDVEYNVIDQDALALQGGDLTDTFSIGVEADLDHGKAGNFFSGSSSAKNNSTIGEGDHLFSGIIDITATQEADSAITGSVSLTLEGVTRQEAIDAIDALRIPNLPNGNYRILSVITQNAENGQGLDSLGTSNIKFVSGFGDETMYETTVENLTSAGAVVSLAFAPADAFIRVGFEPGVATDGVGNDLPNFIADDGINFEIVALSATPTETIGMGYVPAPASYSIDITLTPNLETIVDYLAGTPDAVTLTQAQAQYLPKTVSLVLTDIPDGYSLDRVFKVVYGLNGAIEFDDVEFDDFLPDDESHEDTITFKFKG